MKNKFAEMLAELKDIHAARYQKASTPHYTMLYFGQLREENADKIMDRISTLVNVIKPFALKSGSIGYFGTARHPRVIWIGTQPNEELASLHAQVDQAVGSFAERRESREFQPHLTVARITSARDLIEKKPALEEIISRYDFSCTADRLCLYSVNSETHERQSPIREFHFGC